MLEYPVSLYVVVCCLFTQLCVCVCVCVQVSKIWMSPAGYIDISNTLVFSWNIFSSAKPDQ